MTNILNIYIEDSAPEYVKDYYSSFNNHHEGDAGIDLIIPNDITIGIDIDSCFINHLIHCEMFNKYGKNISYYLYPRSSISKTPLIMSNHIGIIDAGYRGCIISAVRNLDKYNYQIKSKSKLFQICAPDLSPIIIKIKNISELNTTTRGSNGFGSTDKIVEKNENQTKSNSKEEEKDNQCYIVNYYGKLLPFNISYNDIMKLYKEKVYTIGKRHPNDIDSIIRLFDAKQPNYPPKQYKDITQKTYGSLLNDNDIDIMNVFTKAMLS